MQDRRERHNRNINDDVEELHRRHREEGATLTDLANQTGYAASTIRRAFRARNLPIRRVFSGPRLPHQPLAKWLPTNDRHAAELLKTSHTTIDSWRKHGVPATQADRIAVTIGTTPWNIWGTAWQHAMDRYIAIDEAA